MNSKSDLSYLLNITGLSEHKLHLLLEEDEQLLLENLQPSTNVLVDVSFPFFVKHTILRETKGKPFTPNEKEYMTESIVIYPELSKNMTPYVIDKPNISSLEARYYVVLLGMFPQIPHRIYKKGGPAPEFYIQVAKQGFMKDGLHDLADHTTCWIDTLRHIRDFVWNFNRE